MGLPILDNGAPFGQGGAEFGYHESPSLSRTGSTGAVCFGGFFYHLISK